MILTWLSDFVENLSLRIIFSANCLQLKMIFFITKFWLLTLEPEKLNEIVCFNSLIVELGDWKQLNLFR